LAEVITNTLAQPDHCAKLDDSVAPSTRMRVFGTHNQLYTDFRMQNEKSDCRCSLIEQHLIPARAGKKSIDGDMARVGEKFGGNRREQ
jgi:hypothetical protein